MVDTEVERHGTISHERRFDIGPLPLDTDLFARAVRQHWPAENRLRWTLDVVLHEDLGRPQSMATLRHRAHGPLHGADDTHGLEVRRRSAAWDDTDLEALEDRS